VAQLTFRTWLRAEIKAILERKEATAPLMLWCDPELEWREMLIGAADGGGFELWADDKHELVLREELRAAPPKPRVVWVPRRRQDLTFLKVLELQAEKVWTESLFSALMRFGVKIAPEREPELRPLLPSYAREFLDKPLSEWPESLSAGQASAELLTDDLILEVLAHSEEAIDKRVGPSLMSVFSRRLKDDFGLPAPSEHRDERDWRVEATSRLLVTDAVVRVPNDSPPERDRIIREGSLRERSRKMLERWMKDVELMPVFEELSLEADKRMSLGVWARALPTAPPALASRAAEEAVFAKLTSELSKFENLESLIGKLIEMAGTARDHAQGFWGGRARDPVPWATLADLANAASMLQREKRACLKWKSVRDAVDWFTSSGWRLDEIGERLIRDDQNAVGALREIRARLRRAYLRQLDEVNGVFSELLARAQLDELGLRFAGQLLAELRESKGALAVLVLDACRYDLAERIAERLNRGEPVERARVAPARAPLPSITALGMAFAIAPDPAQLSVDLGDGEARRWRVIEHGEKRDLSLAASRREWLRIRFGVKPASFHDVKQVLEGRPPTPSESGRLVFVFGDEFDTAGHEGELEFGGAEGYIERYALAILKLREAGYNTVACVTDHGFIHWSPEKDEILPAPDGDVQWKSRRAIVGKHLEHSSALRLPVPQSDLECMIPRSVGAFQTYGGIGFFHGGATLQELVVPVLKAEWPRRTEKVPVVIGQISQILSLSPTIRLQAGVLPGIGARSTATGRNVQIRIVEPATGRRLFHSRTPVAIQTDGSAVEVALARTSGESCARGSRLRIEARDADNDEILDQREVELKVELTEWD
jgi:hypothetical protein